MQNNFLIYFKKLYFFKLFSLANSELSTINNISKIVLHQRKIIKKIHFKKLTYFYYLQFENFSTETIEKVKILIK